MTSSPTTSQRLRVALVGLGFGEEFVPIYKAHPNIASVAVCDNNTDVLREVCDKYEIAERYTSLDDVLAAEHIDAVHLVTPIPLHGKQSVDVLRSGKHCACTVPMATSLEDIAAIVKAERETGKKYMMMETAVYTREFFMVQEHYKRGDFGTISFARGAHYQDMEGWPEYWTGLPPHHYMTHAIAPVLRLLGTSVEKVHCFGSGQLPAERQAKYGNPFPVETAIFRLKDTNVALEVTRTLFQTVRFYQEAFSIYGDKLGFEWQQIEDELPVVFSIPPTDRVRDKEIRRDKVKAPDRQQLLPVEIAPYTRRFAHENSNHLSFMQGGGHGGSHPHLVHEFVRSILEDRSPSIDAVTAAEWTAPGICTSLPS